MFRRSPEGLLQKRMQKRCHVCAIGGNVWRVRRFIFFHFFSCTVFVKWCRVLFAGVGGFVCLHLRLTSTRLKEFHGAKLLENFGGLCHLRRDVVGSFFCFTASGPCEKH